MLIEIVLNELSMQSLAPSQEDAKKQVKTFLDTIRYAFQNGIHRHLRTHESFMDSNLASGYSLLNWINDFSVPKEERLYLHRLAKKTPFLEGLEDTQGKVTGFEFLFQDRKAEGLGVAFMTGNLSVSFLSEIQWEQPFLSLSIQELQEDGNILEYEGNIRNISMTKHVDQHKEWILELQKKSISNGAELWEQRSIYFPSLVFCDAVQDQMCNLPNSIIKLFFRGLICLEKYCQTWNSGGFNLSELGCDSSSEGETAKKRFAKERTFTCPDDVARTFIYHVKLCNPWRIYYDPAIGPGKMYVGYVGHHLKTKHDH